jgi:effector-binding domain-containing protein
VTAEPMIVERSAQPYVAIKALVTMDTLGTIVPPLNQEVFAWLEGRGVPPAGPPFWKYNVIDMEHGLELEAGVNVTSFTSGDGRVLAGVLPAGRYVTLHHVGHPATLMEATARLLDWAVAKRLTWDVSPSADGERWGCRLELYLTDPQVEPDMNKWETDLVFRLAD